jgi:hypothetical protein
MASKRWDVMNWAARQLIERAAGVAPCDLTERLKEEWMADASAQASALLRLHFAIGCCFAGYVIAREHSAPFLPAAESSAGRRHFIHFPKEEFPPLNSGIVTFVLIVSLNAAVLYGLALGLAPQFKERMAGHAIHSLAINTAIPTNRETQGEQAQ